MNPSRQQTASVLSCLYTILTLSAAQMTMTDDNCVDNFFYDAVYDLQFNEQCVKSPHITVHDPFTVLEECSTRGTLKIELASNATDPGRRAVLVDLFFNNDVSFRSGWTFNLGDSVTNNGYGGDSSSTEYDAEIQNYGSNGFVLYKNDKAAFVNDPTYSNIWQNAYTDRLSLIVRDGHVQWVSDTAFDFLRDDGKLFGLNGQTDDTQGGNVANYDLYLGINKVVRAGSNRIGTGLCKAAIKLLCDSDVETITTTAAPTTTTSQFQTLKPVRGQRRSNRRSKMSNRN